MLAFLQELILPVDCAGCDLPGRPLCSACVAALAPSPSRRVASGVAVTSALAYDGVARRALIRFKNEGGTGVAGPLAEALRAAIALAAPADGAVALVPMPRTRRSAVERGYEPVRVLLRRARLPWSDVLRLGAAPADQIRLTRDERLRNVAGRMRLRGDPPASVLLVDDIVTTGATLAEAARALGQAGALVIGAATVATTPMRSP